MKYCINCKYCKIPFKHTLVTKCKIPLELLPIELQIKYRNDIDLIAMNDNYDCKYYKRKWYKINAGKNE